MDFLLSHWHCILPVIAIVLAAALQKRGKEKKGKEVRKKAEEI